MSTRRQKGRKRKADESGVTDDNDAADRRFMPPPQPSSSSSSSASSSSSSSSLRAKGVSSARSLDAAADLKEEKRSGSGSGRVNAADGEVKSSHEKLKAWPVPWVYDVPSKPLITALNTGEFIGMLSDGTKESFEQALTYAESVGFENLDTRGDFDHMPAFAYWWETKVEDYQLLSKLLNVLLKTGSNVNALESKGWMVYAFRAGSISACTLLVENGAPINAPAPLEDPPDTRFPLAALIGRFPASKHPSLTPEVVRLFSAVIEKADVNQCNRCGETPLMAAVRLGRFEVVRLLLNRLPETDFYCRYNAFAGPEMVGRAPQDLVHHHWNRKTNLMMHEASKWMERYLFDVRNLLHRHTGSCDGGLNGLLTFETIQLISEYVQPVRYDRDPPIPPKS